MLRSVLLLLASLLLTGRVVAQPAPVETIAYGESMIGTVAADGLPVQFTFEGEAGDLVTLQVIGVTPDFTPSIILIAPGQADVISAGVDALNPASNTATLSRRLRESGLYLILVGSSNQTGGDFVLTLDARRAEQAAALSPGIVARVSIEAGSAPQHFTFALSPDGPTRLTITNETSGFAFAAEVRDDAGQVVSRLDRVVQSTQLEFSPGPGSLYQLTLVAAVPGVDGTVTLALSNPANTGAESADVAPAATVLPAVVPADQLGTATPSDTPTLIPTATASPTESATPTPTGPPETLSPFGVRPAGDSANPTPTFTPLAAQLISPPLSSPDAAAANTESTAEATAPVGTPGPTPTFTLIPPDLLPATVVLPTDRPGANPTAAVAEDDLPAQLAPPPTDILFEAPSSVGTSGCTNSAEFIADVTIPDGSTVQSGEPFVKTWRLRNTGTCTWDGRYTFIKISGTLTSGFLADAVAMPLTEPNATVDISIVLAGTGSGTQRAAFQLRDPQGTFFGPQPFVIVNVAP